MCACLRALRKPVAGLMTALRSEHVGPAVYNGVRRYLPRAHACPRRVLPGWRLTGQVGPQVMARSNSSGVPNSELHVELLLGYARCLQRLCRLPEGQRAIQATACSPLPLGVWLVQTEQDQHEMSCTSHKRRRLAMSLSFGVYMVYQEHGDTFKQEDRACCPRTS